MKNHLTKFFKWLWTYLKPFTNWRFLICYGLAWFLTNGMWYVIAGMIPVFIVPIPITPISWMPLWLVNFAKAYIVFLYLPFTPEKLVTIPLAIFFLVKLFKNHSKTRVQLDELYSQAKGDWQKLKTKLAQLGSAKRDEQYIRIMKQMRAERRRQMLAVLLITIFCVSPINFGEGKPTLYGYQIKNRT